MYTIDDIKVTLLNAEDVKDTEKIIPIVLFGFDIVFSILSWWGAYTGELAKNHAFCVYRVLLLFCYCNHLW